VTNENPSSVIKWWIGILTILAAVISLAVLIVFTAELIVLPGPKKNAIIYAAAQILIVWSPVALHFLKLRASASIAASLASLFCIAVILGGLSSGLNKFLLIVPLLYAVIYYLASVKMWQANEVIWLGMPRAGGRPY
jgi:hypothetical protein